MLKINNPNEVKKSVSPPVASHPLPSISLYLLTDNAVNASILLRREIQTTKVSRCRLAHVFATYTSSRVDESVSVPYLPPSRDRSPYSGPH
ncbi:hypothetical protein E2C01_063876 [Portunus trituberculatus]|uniref:Uncharacterized protein n=1 Tax=Portunus trituberculatus TaxID=210409 RepID=A0A5B7HI97_PORTR|nr:hypothetical protein [Portunus trituberculatus]